MVKKELKLVLETKAIVRENEKFKYAEKFVQVLLSSVIRPRCWKCK
jgi:hypothetical protein